jgi:tRNA threonylcarbamoyladenosine biosynthesis protein TsaE
MADEVGSMTVELRRSCGPEDTERIGAALAMRLAPGMLVTLDGDLGAGKTCFVRGLARGLGADPSEVSSPTFVLEHRYAAPGGSNVLVHIDAYRIRSPQDLASIGWDELLAAGEAVVAVEWPSRIAPALPDHRIEVRIRHAGEDVREIEIEDVRPAAHATRCASCGAPIAAGAMARFCSDRCRMSDLGRWFRGDYAIGRPIEEDDLHGDTWGPGDRGR